MTMTRVAWLKNDGCCETRVFDVAKIALVEAQTPFLQRDPL